MGEVGGSFQQGLPQVGVFPQRRCFIKGPIRYIMLTTNKPRLAQARINTRHALITTTFPCLWRFAGYFLGVWS